MKAALNSQESSRRVLRLEERFLDLMVTVWIVFVTTTNLYNILVNLMNDIRTNFVKLPFIQNLLN